MDASAEALIAARLDRIEASLAELLARSGRTVKAPPAGKARRVTVREFCERQGVSVREFGRTYARLFTDTRPLDKRGIGRHRKLEPDEVAVFFSDGAEALANFRARMRRA